MDDEAGRRGIFYEIITERNTQDDKWGEQNHWPDRWMTILGEEYGEACEAILERETEQYRRELIQVAAVAVAAIECLDRRKTREDKSDGL